MRKLLSNRRVWQSINQMWRIASNRAIIELLTEYQTSIFSISVKTSPLNSTFVTNRLFDSTHTYPRRFFDSAVYTIISLTARRNDKCAFFLLLGNLFNTPQFRLQTAPTGINKKNRIDLKGDPDVRVL